MSTRSASASHRRWCSRSLAQQNLVLPARNRLEIHTLKVRARAAGKANSSDQLFHPVICPKTSRNAVLANLLIAEFKSCEADHRDYAGMMFLQTGPNVPKMPAARSHTPLCDRHSLSLWEVPCLPQAAHFATPIDHTDYGEKSRRADSKIAMTMGCLSRRSTVMAKNCCLTVFNRPRIST